MNAEPTTISEEFGIMDKMATGIPTSLLSLFLAIIFRNVYIDVPISIGCLILAIILPLIMIFRGYLAKGECPHCHDPITVSKKRGGMKCKSCEKSIAIKNGMLHAI